MTDLPEWAMEMARGVMEQCVPGMCLTYRHDFGVMLPWDRDYLKRQFSQIAYHSAPTIARALVDAKACGRNAGLEEAARIANKRAQMCRDAVAKTEAGLLYPNTPNAQVTERTAALEAEHIARAIRAMKDK